MTESNCIQRPWGKYITYIGESNFLIKMLLVNPNSMTSLQLHKNRDEHWVVIEGTPTIIYNGIEKEYKSNDYIMIEKSKTHRIINNTETIIKIVEIQTGDPNENDIERVSDIYGRLCVSNMETPNNAGDIRRTSIV